MNMNAKKAIAGGAGVAGVLAFLVALDPTTTEQWFALVRNYPIVFSMLISAGVIVIVVMMLYRERNECHDELTKLRELFYPVLRANVRDGDLKVTEAQFKRGEFDKDQIKEVVERRSEAREEMPIVDRRGR